MSHHDDEVASDIKESNDKDKNAGDGGGCSVELGSWGGQGPSKVVQVQGIFSYDKKYHGEG